MSGAPPPTSPPPASPQPISPPPGESPGARSAADPLPQRYEATIHTSRRTLAGVDALAGVSDLDLDRVPDPDGGVRVLIDHTEIARLIGQGYEVRLQEAIPVQPLDPSLIASDGDVDGWFAERMSGSAARERSVGERPPGDEQPEGNG